MNDKSAASESKDAKLYLELATTWSAVVFKNAKSANKIFDAIRALAKEMASTPEGRAAIEDAFASDIPGVRLLASSHALRWSPERALTVLEGVQADQSAGLHSVSAKYTVLQYKGGTLNLDW